MAAPVTAPLPPNLDLDMNYRIRFAALSPTDGSAVANVKVANVNIIADPIAFLPSQSGPTDPPLFVPVPVN